MYRILIILILLIISCSIGGIGDTENQIEFHNVDDILNSDISENMNNSLIYCPILCSDGKCGS